MNKEIIEKNGSLEEEKQLDTSGELNDLKENLFSIEVEELKKSLEEAKSQIAELEKARKENEKYENHLLDYVKKEWELLGVKKPLNKTNIDIKTLDYKNIRKSILAFLDKEGLAFEPLSINPVNRKIDSDNKVNNVRIVNGIVIK